MKFRYAVAAITLALLGVLWGVSPEGRFVVAEDPLSRQTIDLEPQDDTRHRTVPLRLYLSPGESPHPVILYSHGLGGSRLSKAYLGQHWSAAGFVCVFMQHAGSDREVIRSAKPLQTFKALKAAASIKSSLDRIDDVSFVLDQLDQWNKLEGHALFGKLDLQHIGMSGHSFGAATTMAVSGRRFPFRKTFAEPRIDAFLAMSPQAGKGISAERAFGSISQPLFCITGTKDGSPIDASVTPDSRQSVFRAMPEGDKFQLVLKDAHHFSFGDEQGQRGARRRNPRHHPTIQQLSTAFWRAYLSGDEEAKQWLQSDRPQTEDVLGPSDQWEWK